MTALHQGLRQGVPARRSILVALAWLLALAASPAPAPVAAASCLVTTLADAGGGSLRAALADANCATIAFQPGLTGIITLRSALPTIARDLQLTGPGRDLLVISGDGLVRPLLVAGGTVTVAGLTVAYGLGTITSGGYVPDSYGGGVAIRGGTVTLRQARVRDSRSYTGFGIGDGGGIYVGGGAVTLDDVEVRGNRAEVNGGGIMQDFNYEPSGHSSLTIVGSVLVQNNAGVAGGAVAGGSFGNLLTVASSTVAANGARQDGGGLYFAEATIVNSTISGNTADGAGGGIMHFSGWATIANTTLSGNTAGTNGGGLVTSGRLRIAASTIADNVAGVSGGGMTSDSGSEAYPEVGGSIILSNRHLTTPEDCFTAANIPAFATRGYNVVGAGTGCPATGPGDVAFAGPASAVIAPALADNGGPTRTHAPIAGGPAIDRQPLSAEGCVSIDQRGAPRPVGAGCDSGAVESGAAVATHCASFADLPARHPACLAIATLGAAGVIQGYATTPPTLGPDDQVQRAQVAALLVRALGWQGLPAGPRTFTDFGALPQELRTAVLILANQCDLGGGCVASGYDPMACAAREAHYPCFGPNDWVTYAQVISFIARAFALDAHYGWRSQPFAVQPYPDVPAVHDTDFRHEYEALIPGMQPSAPALAAD